MAAFAAPRDIEENELFYALNTRYVSFAVAVSATSIQVQCRSRKVVEGEDSTLKVGNNLVYVVQLFTQNVAKVLQEI